MSGSQKETTSVNVSAAEDSAKALDRRTWMSWVGKAAVLSLGAELIAACEEAGRKTSGTDADSGLNDTDTGGGAEADGGEPFDGVPCADGTLKFEPGGMDKALYESWPVRTVDPQNLEAILADWRLSVDGMVQRPQVFSFVDLLRMPRQDQITDFHCVEGWSILDVPWNGVHLSRLLNDATPLSGATHITFHTIDEAYNESLPLEIALEPKTLLAYGIDCATLPLDRGFPLRLVVPRLLAYKSAKFVYRVELTDHPISGYWVERGYPYEAIVPDTRLREGKY